MPDPLLPTAAQHIPNDHCNLSYDVSKWVEGWRRLVEGIQVPAKAPAPADLEGSPGRGAGGWRAAPAAGHDFSLYEHQHSILRFTTVVNQ